MIIVISTSRHPDSKSRILAKIAYQELQKKNQEVQFLDLQELSLPICDGKDAYNHTDAIKATELIKKATAIILALPIYNYSAAASCKNLIELTGNEWKDKPVAIITASGSHLSFLASSNIVLPLLFDFRCYIIPKMVTADSSYFSTDGKIIQEEIYSRISDLVDQTLLLQYGLLLAKQGKK